MRLSFSRKDYSSDKLMFKGPNEAMIIQTHL